MLSKEEQDIYLEVGDVIDHSRPKAVSLQAITKVHYFVEEFRDVHQTDESGLHGEKDNHHHDHIDETHHIDI